MLFILLFAASLVAGQRPAYNPAPYSYGIRSRQAYNAQSNDSSSIEVDLGYSVYRGVFNSTTNQNVFLGYAIQVNWQMHRLTSIAFDMLKHLSASYDGKHLEHLS